MNKRDEVGRLAENIFGLLSYQEKLLSVHEENFSLQLHYAKTVAKLFRRELDLLEQGIAMQSGVMGAMSLLKEHDEETQRVSKNHLSRQDQFIKLTTDVIKEHFLIPISCRRY